MQMEMTRRVCVTGGTGYIGSWLVHSLLRSGYHVHATARDMDKALQVLSCLDGNGNDRTRLSIFRADLNEEGSFDEAINGCHAVFHVAASMDFHVSSPSPQQSIEEHARSSVLEPAIRGTINVLQACVRAGTVKRVIFTSSISTLTPNTSSTHQQQVPVVVDESCLTPIHQIWRAKPYGWVYLLSKRLTEEEAFKFANDNGIDLVSIIPSTVAGPFLTPSVPTSVQVLLSPVTGDPKLYPILVSVHSRFGSLPLVHIEDICDAHIFLLETPAAEGRYLCTIGGCTISQLADILSSEYPCFSSKRLQKEFHASTSFVVSPRRLTDLGFKFKYDARGIIKQSVASCIDRDFLKHPAAAVP